MTRKIQREIIWGLMDQQFADGVSQATSPLTSHPRGGSASGNSQAPYTTRSARDELNGVSALQQKDLLSVVDYAVGRAAV